jgi:hypothetical protein
VCEFGEGGGNRNNGTPSGLAARCGMQRPSLCVQIPYSAPLCGSQGHSVDIVLIIVGRGPPMYSDN